MAVWIGILFLHVPQYTNLFVIAAELAITFLARSVFGAVSGWSAARFAANAKLDIRSHWMSQLFKLSPVKIEKMQTGELTTTAVTGVENLESYLARYLPQSIEAVLVPVVLLIYILRLDWISAVLLVITAPVIVFFMILLGKGADSVAHKQWHVLQDLSSRFLEMIEGLMALKLFSRSTDAKRILSRIGDANRVATMKTLRIAFLSAFVLELFATLGTAAVALALGLRLIHAELAFTPALTVLLLTPEFFQPIRALGSEFHAGLNGLAAAESLFELFDEPDEEINAHDIPWTIANGLPDIRFTNIRFHYPGEKKDTLGSFNLTIQPEQRIAIVGPSGCGKTTLLKLLSGTLSPSAGIIEVGGKQVQTLASPTWRKLVTLLNQQPHIFSGSIRDNLLMAIPMGEMVGDDQLHNVLRKAGLTTWFRSLPNGLDTQIGDGGRMVSGGEAQRIAIARAWLRKSPLLLLDEPTAHLDPLTAAEIETALDELMVNRTVIVVTHDPGLASRMDRVILLTSRGIRKDCETKQEYRFAD
ncbi:thiol reductant ABC exporter subunit CydD [Alicyclobacillus fastidiosus]|nr:thiol reductant ABC exporter subunit CydD [Alicyclobacillus fastidiosus]